MKSSSGCLKQTQIQTNQNMITERYPDNVPGAWFTNDECTCCTLCGEIAPEVFRESDEGTHHIVHSHPASVDQLALAEEAKEACPVEAIESGGGYA